MTNFIKKILFNFFSVRNFKFLILILVFSYFALAPAFLPVLAQTATPVPLVSKEVESSAQPCSLYGDYNWGYSINPIGDKAYISLGSGGLYKQFDRGSFQKSLLDGNQNKEVTKTQEIFDGFRKDPIYLTTDRNVTRQDPILGVPTGELNNGISRINSNVIKMPCLSTGSLTGLIPRRYSDGENTNFVNCPINSNIIFAQSNSHCEEDNSIAGNSIGGCTIDMYFSDNSSSSVQAGNVDGFLSDRVNHALKGAVVRLVYSSDSLLKKTVMNSNPPSNIDLSRQGSINYTSKFNSYYDVDSRMNATDADKFQGEQNIVYYTGGQLEKNQFFYASQSKLVPWFNYSKNSSEKLAYSFSNDQAIWDNIDKTSFVCKYRTVNNVKIFEWLPSSVTQIRIPSCESFGPNASKVIELPSAVNGKTTLVCTPCTVPTLFQSDLFGQPVRGIPTSLGCFPSSLEGNITALLRIASMMAGGIAALIITISGIRITLNSGNPEEIKKAQKGISSAIVGLLVIVSSVLLLNLIGVKLLDLSSFGGNTVEFVTTGKG